MKDMTYMHSTSDSDENNMHRSTLNNTKNVNKERKISEDIQTLKSDFLSVKNAAMDKQERRFSASGVGVGTLSLPNQFARAAYSNRPDDTFLKHEAVRRKSSTSTTNKYENFNAGKKYYNLETNKFTDFLKIGEEEGKEEEKNYEEEDEEEDEEEEEIEKMEDSNKLKCHDGDRKISDCTSYSTNNIYNDNASSKQKQQFELMKENFLIKYNNNNKNDSNLFSYPTSTLRQSRVVYSTTPSPNNTKLATECIDNNESIRQLRRHSNSSMNNNNQRQTLIYDVSIPITLNNHPKMIENITKKSSLNHDKIPFASSSFSSNNNLNYSQEGKKSCNQNFSNKTSYLNDDFASPYRKENTTDDRIEGCLHNNLFVPLFSNSCCCLHSNASTIFLSLKTDAQNGRNEERLCYTNNYPQNALLPRHLVLKKEIEENSQTNDLCNLNLKNRTAEENADCSQQNQKLANQLKIQQKQHSDNLSNLNNSNNINTQSEFRKVQNQFICDAYTPQKQQTQNNLQNCDISLQQQQNISPQIQAVVSNNNPAITSQLSEKKFFSLSPYCCCKMNQNNNDHRNAANFNYNQNILSTPKLNNIKNQNNPIMLQRSNSITVIPSMPPLKTLVLHPSSSLYLQPEFMFHNSSKHKYLPQSNINQNTQTELDDKIQKEDVTTTSFCCKTKEKKHTEFETPRDCCC